MALAALCVFPTVVSEAQTEGHEACEALEENTICRGICERWIESPKPWRDAELVSRAEACFNQGNRWDGYSPPEEVVVTGIPVPTIPPTVFPPPSPRVIIVTPTPSLPPSLPDIRGADRNTIKILDCIHRLTTYDTADLDDQLIRNLRDAEIQFLYGDLGGTTKSQTRPEHALVPIPGNSAQCRTRTHGYQIQLDNAQIGNSGDGTVRERRAMYIVHELVHVALYEAGEHPCITGEHPIGDAIYELGWRMYRDIFGIPAPEDSQYIDTQTWNSRRPTCLRE